MPKILSAKYYKVTKKSGMMVKNVPIILLFEIYNSACSSHCSHNILYWFLTKYFHDNITDNENKT